MRLSAGVNQHGIDSFTREDFLFVGQKLTHDPSRLILVGGQALEVWGVIFDVLAPTGNKHPLTADTDWLGSKRDAQWLCDQLGPDVELHLATDFATTASTAVAFLKRPDGRVLMMDFLRTIVGPTNETVQRLSVPIKVNGITLNVLHPLLCLESRLGNIAIIAAKRNGNGVMQAKWAINIATAYLLKIASDGDLKQANKACHSIAYTAQSKHARYCFVHYSLDPMLAVSAQVVNAIGGRFASEDWPRTQAMIDKKRARWAPREA